MKPDYIIFTDGSVRQNHKKDTGVECSYGIVIINTETNKYTFYREDIPERRTIAYVEAYAIYVGLKMTVKVSGRDTKILVVTDSKINVDILNDYIPNLWDISDWMNWKKSDGKRVKNQSVYRKILTFIRHKRLDVKYVHIRSHQSLDNAGYIMHCMKENGISMNKKTAKAFIKMNYAADKLASSDPKAIRRMIDKLQSD